MCSHHIRVPVDCDILVSATHPLSATKRSGERTHTGVFPCMLLPYQARNAQRHKRTITVAASAAVARAILTGWFRLCTPEFPMCSHHIRVSVCSQDFRSVQARLLPFRTIEAMTLDFYMREQTARLV